MNETALVHLSRARQELQTAKTFEDVRIGLNKAEQLRLLAQQVDASIEIKNEVTELLLRWQRRAGEMLKEGREKGERDNGTGGDRRSRSHDVTVKPPTLAEIGIGKMESSRWQSIATVPEEKFEKTIRETKEAREELTQAAVLRLAKEQRREEVREQNRELIAEAREAGITPQEDAANDPGVRWSKAMHKLWVFINGTRDHGGIGDLTRKWSVSVKRGYLVELREMRDKITEWIETIEKELAK